MSLQGLKSLMGSTARGHRFHHARMLPHTKLAGPAGRCSIGSCLQVRRTSEYADLHNMVGYIGRFLDSAVKIRGYEIRIFDLGGDMLPGGAVYHGRPPFID